MNALKSTLLSPLIAPSSSTVVSQVQTRWMSKYMSKAAKKRIPLNTKRVAKGFYKGNGGTKEGRLTSKAKFMVDPMKQVELIVPNLKGFQLKPYIASTASRFPPEERFSPVSK